MDTNKLKELAERATPGRNFDRLPSAGGGLKYTCTGDDDSLVLRVDHKNGEFGFIGPKGEEDEAFFLACTPKAVLELIAEVERLRNRLEIDERTPYDGIACRDETIKGLDEKCDRLKAENEALRKQLEQVHPFKFAGQHEGHDLKCAACGGYHYGLPPNMPCPKSAAIAQDAAALEGGGR
ncbi:hypothetical protein [Pseudomonas sp.]|uniref:hypothetical protein n=1 Tax=Pseudomonas sp. TaxID=306 RepID=UPI00290FD95D|nr:hypothetical protein [Pseudomonas sp.]MDU4249073.1 hypothetical protein [Pseudomonas sp.]